MPGTLWHKSGATVARAPGGFKLLRALPAILTLATVPASARPSEDGAGGRHCGACHELALAAWAGSGHARAFDALPEERRADPACLGCHRSGPEPTLRGVTCESCHGPASEHVPLDRRGRSAARPKVERATCLRCHTADAPRPFVWERFAPRIAHARTP